MNPTTALVFCGGGRATAPLGDIDSAVVVAADVGVAEALRHGLRVDLLIGDLDSAAPDDVQRVSRDGATVDRHPQDKDATDLELAVEAAAGTGVSRVVVVGGRLGRLDHLLGNALLLAAPRFAGLEVDAVFGAARLHVVRGHRELRGDPDELVSLFALQGPARGVTTTGLRWKLDGDDLAPGSSLGISNRFVEHAATVSVDDGVVLVVRPGTEGST
jgi:thiamine pyrophosphokinase